MSKSNFSCSVSVAQARLVSNTAVFCLNDVNDGI